MEEDVEIEVLYTANEQILIEAANDSDQINEVPAQVNKSIEVFNGSQNVTLCNFDSDSMAEAPNSSPRSVKKESLSENIVEGAGDQVEQHVLDLLHLDPLNAFMLHQGSYIQNYEKGNFEDDDNLSRNQDNGDYNEYKHDNYFDNVLEEPRIQSSKELFCYENETVQKSIKKAIPKLRDLGDAIIKRNEYLSALSKKLLELSKEIKLKQIEAQDLIIEAEKNKSRQSGSSKNYFRKFGIPYFSDNKGFYAPPNKDHQQKLDNDELMLDSIFRPTEWTKSHKEVLQTEIKNSLVAEKSDKLTKEIMKLSSKLQETTAKHKIPNKQINIVKKIIKKQDELKGLHKKSLKELVEDENENREYDWMQFSSITFNGQHSAEECKNFWNLYLKPNINKGHWTDHEDLRLAELGAQLDYQDWDKISKLLETNRSGYQCFVHYKARVEGRSQSSSGKWTKKEDKKLLTVINSSKLGDYIPWNKVSSYMANRNHAQIYTRWVKSLNPELVKGKFSKEEDLLIVAGVEVFGATFKQLTLFLKHRTSSQLRERYERYLLPKTAKVGIWSLEEDEKLLKLVQDNGAHNWSRIAKEMKTRTRTQVRQRYGFIQKMMTKCPGWTVAKVKRRNGKQKKGLDNIRKDVAKIKNVVSRIENVCPLSKLEKETFLLEKLAELRHKIFSKSRSKKGRKKREVAINLNSELNSAIVDLFLVCSTRCQKNSVAESFPNSTLNQLLVLNNFFGFKFHLPRSENEINDNPRLSFPLKCCLKSALNTNHNEFLPRSLLTDSHSSSQANTGNIESTCSIDYCVPEYDDTIMMMDWWHTSPVNISRLNFSEFFKRTVFDYSTGLHKDIWDSKLRRSQEVSNRYDYSENIEKKVATNPKYLLPPNRSTSIGIRSIYVSQAILKRHSSGMGTSKCYRFNDFKKEVNEDSEGNKEATFEAIQSLCNKYQSILLQTFAWSHILSVNSIKKVSGYNDHCPRKILEVLQENMLSNKETALDSSTGNISQETTGTGLCLDKKRKLKVKDAHRKEFKGKREVKKRKLIDRSSVSNFGEENCESHKKSKQSFRKKRKKDTIGGDTILNDENLPNKEMSHSLPRPRVYLQRKSTRLKSCNKKKHIETP